MSHKNKISLRMQAAERMKEMTCIGRSKHADKIAAMEKYEREKPVGISKKDYVDEYLRDKIYSSATYRTYEKHINYFLDFCRERGCRTLDACRDHADAWLQSRAEAGLSAWTLATEKAALSKLYREPSRNFVDTPARCRKNIKRSRNDVVRDRGFSESRNIEIVNFCRGTGLRRSELASLRPEQLSVRDENYFLRIKGKGGKVRDVPIIGEHKQEIVDRIKNTAAGERVWQRVPSHMDVHAYRADYATELYKLHARDIKDIPYDKINRGTGRAYQSDVYHCQRDRAGEKFDKYAMKIVSRALGHNRIDIIAGHYLR